MEQAHAPRLPRVREKGGAVNDTIIRVIIFAAVMLAAVAWGLRERRRFNREIQRGEQDLRAARARLNDIRAGLAADLARIDRQHERDRIGVEARLAFRRRDRGEA